MGFKVKSSEKNNIGIITLEGEVDMFTSPELRDKLTSFFEKDVNAIVVDLGQVSFMDSSGIATLVEGLQWSRKNSREFILTGLKASVKSALALTKLDNVFNIKKDTDEAFDSLA